MHQTTIAILLPVLLSSAPAGPPGKTKKDERKASDAHSIAVGDGTLIAEWLFGRDPNKVFKSGFGDSRWLTKGKDVVLYTDICGLKAPKGARSVTYEAIRARISKLKGAHRVSPAVLIVRSTRERPESAIRRIKTEERLPKPKPLPKNARYYYVEVGIGNLAWHWFRIAVYEENKKVRVRFLESAIS